MVLRLLSAAACAALLAAAFAPALAAGPNDVLPEAPAKAIVIRACTNCHQAPQIVAKRLTPEAWDAMMGKMIDRGARMTEDEEAQVYDYLVANFGPLESTAAAK